MSTTKKTKGKVRRIVDDFDDLEQEEHKYKGWVVAYVRVSTLKQVPGSLASAKMVKRNRVSLKNQEANCRRYAERHNYGIRAICVDAGKSGTTLRNREKLKEAIDLIEPGDIFLVSALDRVARSTRDAISIFDQIESRGGKFVSATENHYDSTTPAGLLMRAVASAFAEFETNIDSERAKGASNYRKEMGFHVGGIPYGKRLEGKYLVDEPEEMKVVTHIIRMREKGKFEKERIPSKKKGRKPSFEIIAKELNERGFRRKPVTRKGEIVTDLFNSEFVRRIYNRYTKEREKQEFNPITDLTPDILALYSKEDMEILLRRIEEFKKHMEDE